MEFFGSICSIIFVAALLLIAYWVLTYKNAAARYDRTQQPQDANEHNGGEIPVQEFMNSLMFSSRQIRMLLLSVDRRRCISQASGNPLFVSAQEMQDAREISRNLCNLLTSSYATLPSDGAVNRPIEHDHCQPTNSSLNHCCGHLSIEEVNQSAQNQEGEDGVATLREADERIHNNQWSVVHAQNPPINQECATMLMPPDVTILTEGVSDSVTVVNANPVDVDASQSAHDRRRVSGSGNRNAHCSSGTGIGDAHCSTSTGIGDAHCSTSTGIGDAHCSTSTGIGDGRTNPSVVGAVSIDTSSSKCEDATASESGKEPTRAEGDGNNTTAQDSTTDVGLEEQLLSPNRNDGIGDLG